MRVPLRNAIVKIDRHRARTLVVPRRVLIGYRLRAGSRAIEITASDEKELRVSRLANGGMAAREAATIAFLTLSGIGQSRDRGR